MLLLQIPFNAYSANLHSYNYHSTCKLAEFSYTSGSTSWTDGNASCSRTCHYQHHVKGYWNVSESVRNMWTYTMDNDLSNNGEIDSVAKHSKNSSHLTIFFLPSLILKVVISWLTHKNLLMTLAHIRVGWVRSGSVLHPIH